MNTDMPQSEWNRVSSQVQTYWPQIDDADLARIAGSAARLAEVLQLKCGYTPQNAETQSVRWMRKHRDGPGDAE